ncbi:hypothetical protein, partial [Ruminococcus sp.]|uniref:hypothetical protein n=1 Tax=Ruminococcus sp. TaxID=41978 RepID=UPI0038708DA7
MSLAVIIPTGLTVTSAETGSAMEEAKGDGMYAVNAKTGNIDWFSITDNPADADYSSESDTVLAVFHCTVDESATGTLDVDFDGETFFFTSVDNKDGLEYTSTPTSITITSSETTAPTEAAPTEPAPTEPAPTEPAPTEPAPTEPAPTEPAHVHDLQFVNEVPATTEATGVRAHYECSGCGKLFSDAMGAVEVTMEDLIIPIIVPTDPAPTEPAPTEPAPTEPAPTEPAPTEPAPT